MKRMRREAKGANEANGLHRLDFRHSQCNKIQAIFAPTQRVFAPLHIATSLQDTESLQGASASLQDATSLQDSIGYSSPIWDDLVPLLANSGPMLDNNDDDTRRVAPVGVKFDDDRDEPNSPRGVHDEDAKAMSGLLGASTGALIPENYG